MKLIKIKSKNKKYEIWIDRKKEIIIFMSKGEEFQKLPSCVYRMKYERLNEILKEQAKPIIKDYFTTSEYWKEILNPDLRLDSDQTDRQEDKNSNL